MDLIRTAWSHVVDFVLLTLVVGWVCIFGRRRRNWSRRLIVAGMFLLFASAGVCFAQGGNCEPPTPEELSRMQEARRSSVVAPAPVASVSKYRGTNRKPVPTRREAELLKEIKRLERELDELKRLMRGEPQEDPVPWVESGASRQRPADNRTWTAQDWADYVDEYAVYGAGG